MIDAVRLHALIGGDELGSAAFAGPTGPRPRGAATRSRLDR